MEVLSAFRGRGADRRWGFGASYGSKVREETGRLSPPQSVTAFRLSSMVIGRRSRLLSSNLVFLGLRRVIALKTVYNQSEDDFRGNLAKKGDYTGITHMAPF